MDLEKFVAQLRELAREIREKTEILEESTEKGFDAMSDLLQKLEALLPDWIFFIEQTEIGNKEHILMVLSDMEKAMQAEDSILLGDTLLNGLGIAAEEYIKVIEEALHEE